MVDITIKHDIARAISFLDDGLRGQLPFALSRTLNETAKIVQPEVVVVIQKNLDRPTPFVQKSVLIKYSNKQNLQAVVYIRDRELSKSPNSLADIIAQQFRGGPRIRTRLEGALTRSGLISSNEFVAPGAGARLDQYGNMSRGQIQQLLSQIFASPNRESNRTSSTRSRLSVRRAGRIFWSRGERLPRGAYIEVAGGIKPLLLVVTPPKYRQRIDMELIAQRVVNRDFNRIFSIELDKALRTAR
jgi:hypothetical protein